MVISTKAGYGMWSGPYGDWGSRKYLIASLDQSLERMGLEYVDIFYHHRPDPNTPLEETMTALDHIIRQGKALYVGISNYNAQEMQQASQLLRSLGTPCLINQVAYNMLDRWVEPDILNVAKQEGVGLIFYSPLAQGMLTDRYLNGVPTNSRAGKAGTFLQKDKITSDYLYKIRQLNDLAIQRGQTMAQMALAWVMRHPNATSVLIGASYVKQIEDNIAIVDKLDFSDDELTQIDTVLEG